MTINAITCRECGERTAFEVIRDSGRELGVEKHGWWHRTRGWFMGETMAEVYHEVEEAGLGICDHCL